jgi:hypothetical protein
LVIIPEREKHFGSTRLCERIILKWMLEKRIEGCGLDSSGLGLGPVVGSCEYCNKPSFVKER